MLIKRIEDIPATLVEIKGAEKTHVRVLFGPNDGAPTFALRQFDLDEAGCTPYHSHPFEHQVVVLAGELLAVTEQGEIPLNVGDAAMVLPGEVHQFRNASATKPARMLCVIPVEYQKS